ncbi:MAG: putative acyl-CoA dehydrogenase [Acidimicrobiia bacterium]|nr:putative acyl-CoA dehydrogenase [Acidimicrobiia bacterium]
MGTDQIEADVRQRVDQLLLEHANDDEKTFLGAQFDAGLAWIHWPEGIGGLGLEPGLQRVVDERLEAENRKYPWLRNPMGIGMVGPSIAAHGTSEHHRHLRAIFTAEELWCQLFSEPGAGSDVATLATRAERDGDEWVANGQKVWTSLAAQASFGLLIARTDPTVPKHQGLSAFILDMHAPGVETRGLRQITGRSDEFCEVFIENVRIPDSQRVGEPGDGWRVAVTTLMNERVSIGGSIDPQGSGPIAVAVDAYQKGGRNPLYRDQLMKLWIEAEVLRLGNLRAAQSRAKGTPGPEGSVLKMGGALSSQRIAAFAVDVVGADAMLFDGYQDGREKGRRLGDAVGQFLQVQASTIAGGTSEVMRNILGERVLGLPGEPRIDRDLPWNQIPRGA